MDPPNPDDDTSQNDGVSFSDALDDGLPLHDSTITDQSDDQSTSSEVPCTAPAETTVPASTLRRRVISRGGGSIAEHKEASQDSSSTGSGITGPDDSKRSEIYLDLEEKETYSDSSESPRMSLNELEPDLVEPVEFGVRRKEEEESESTVSTAKDERVGEWVDSEGERGDSSFSLPVFLAGLVVKAIDFQFNLFISFITFPIRALYYSYLLAVDPFGVMRRIIGCFTGKLASLRNSLLGLLSPVLGDWVKDNKSMSQLVFQFGWGLFWSIYVCMILFGLLVFSILISGVFIRYIVEEPIQIREDLNFDYTKNSPVAYVPVMSCNAVDCGVNCLEKVRDVRSLGPRAIPPNHKLQLTLFLKLPESEYNRNLGVFQVRVDFLSAKGKILASKSQPCMLKFKSEPIRFFLTFLKIAPLVAGYVSESQTLELKIRGFTERNVPTSCLKVTIEQRAEFRPGAGVPEIYDTSLIVESELPYFRKMIWSWKKTIFIWICISSFIVELFFVLICCRPLIIPRPRDGSAINTSTPERS